MTQFFYSKNYQEFGLLKTRSFIFVKSSKIYLFMTAHAVTTMSCDSDHQLRHYHIVISIIQSSLSISTDHEHLQLLE